MQEQMIKAQAANIKKILEDSADLFSDEMISQMRVGVDIVEDSTNGLKPEEKVQRLTESNMCSYNVLVVLAREVAQIRKEMTCATPSWKDVVVRARWQITIIALALALLLGFHPELVAVLDKFIGE